MEPTPKSGRLSLRDLGKMLGVSHVTVSLALRDNPRISQKVRDSVQKLAQELNYRPDPMLAALAQYRKDRSPSTITATIAWINAWQPAEQLREYKEFDAYWIGACRAAAKFGYRLEEFRLGEGYTPARLNQILATRGIRGILLPPQKPHPNWGSFPWEHYSVVRFGRSLKTPQTHIVTADQVLNTMQAFKKICELGYQRIGYVTYESDLSERGHLFEAGFLLAQRSIPEDQRLPICNIDRSPCNGRVEALIEWKEKYRPDAIFSDLSDIPDVLKRAGIRVPDDVGLAMTTLLDSEVDAGINQHPEEIGRVGFLTLNSLINDGARGIPQIFRQTLVEGSWVDGSMMPRKV